MLITNGRAKVLGALALLVQGLVSNACTGSRIEAPTGGLGGSAGSAGASGSAGAAGTAGSGGTRAPGTCDKGGTVGPVGIQCMGIGNGLPCDRDGVAGTADDAACWNTCGPNKSGTSACTCVAGTWNCPRTCDYDISDPGKFDCYKTADFVACPPDPTDTSGMMVPAAGGACALPPCKPCGSTTAVAFRDSSGAPKIGWCVCVPRTNPAVSGNVYTCASVTDWAPQCQ